MSQLRQAKSVKNIPLSVESEPLSVELLDDFYILADRARDASLPPSNLLQDTVKNIFVKSEPTRLLFASYKGAGKSTEINRLMKELGESFWFLHVSVREVLDMAQLEHIDLVVALIEQLYKRGQKEDLIQDSAMIGSAFKWLRQVVLDSRILSNDEVKSIVNSGDSTTIEIVVDFFERLRAAFTSTHESATMVRQVLGPRIGDLRNYCNAVIKEIENNLSQRIPVRRLLIIVEDTDKLDTQVAHDLFIEHTGLLAELETSILYTVPLFLLPLYRHRLEVYFDIVTLPMIKTYDQDNQPFAIGWQILQEIVKRRIDPALIDDDALDLAIEKTGGILRDLFNVIATASQVAHYAKRDKIIVEDVRNGLDRLKSVYRNSIDAEALYQRLREIHGSRGKLIISDETLQDLVSRLVVIEYTDADSWYRLHPLVQEIVEEVG